MIDPILITGCARSGTSMTAGIVHICGAFGGYLAGAHKENKRGMFENLEVRNWVIKPFFRQIDADPRCQKPLPDINKVFSYTNNRSFVVDWGSRVRRIYLKQGYYKGPWFIKDPKIAVHWPIWDAAFPNAKWIIVRRDGGDIIHSCLQTGFMKAYQTEEGWKHWVIQHHRCFQQMINGGLCIRQVWPQDMINGDLQPMRSCISDFLELEWKEKEVLNFITPALWSNAKRKRNGQNKQRVG